MSRLYFILLCFFLCPSYLDAIEDKSKYTEIHYGRAYTDEGKLNLVYTEKHIAFFEKGTLLRSTNEYFDIGGKKIAELNSDYTKSFVLPTYVFRDFRTGIEEGVALREQDYFIFRGAPDKSREWNRLKEIKNVFSCQGWHYYLVANLDRVTKQSIQMKLIFPSELDYYSFRVRTLDTDDQFLKLRLEFDNWFMRIFAPYLDITYDRFSKKIVKYYGPSNILDNKGELQNVHIFYRHDAKRKETNGAYR